MAMCNYNDYTKLIIALFGLSKEEVRSLTLNFKISEENNFVQKLDNYPLLYKRNEVKR